MEHCGIPFIAAYHSMPKGFPSLRVSDLGLKYTSMGDGYMPPALSHMACLKAFGIRQFLEVTLGPARAGIDSAPVQSHGLFR